MLVFSEDAPAQSCQVNTVILYRDQSDIAHMREVFGDDLLDNGAVKIKNPSDLKEFFSSNSVGSCFMFVEAKPMQEELQKRSHATPYEDLLRTIRKKVGKDAFSEVQLVLYGVYRLLSH